MAIVRRITWLGNGTQFSPPEIQLGQYTLPVGVPVVVGDDIIPSPQMRASPLYRIEETDE